MKRQLEAMREYLTREDAELEVVDRIQELLNASVKESVSMLMR